MTLQLFAVEKAFFDQLRRDSVAEFLRWLYHEADHTTCDRLEELLCDATGLPIDDLEQTETPLQQIMDMEPTLALPVLRAVSVCEWSESRKAFFNYSIEQLTGRNLGVEDLRELLLDHEFHQEIITLSNGLAEANSETTEMFDKGTILALAEFYDAVHQRQLHCILVQGEYLYNLDG